MRAVPSEEGFVSGKGGLFALAVLVAVLVGALIYFLPRVGNKTADALTPGDSVDAAQTNLLTAEEIDRQHAQYQPPPVPAVAVAPPAVSLPKQNEAEIVLQKEKAAFNSKIVERMKQYVKDHPMRDTRELERQIQIRETQGGPIQ